MSENEVESENKKHCVFLEADSVQKATMKLTKIRCFCFGAMTCAISGQVNYQATSTQNREFAKNAEDQQIFDFLARWWLILHIFWVWMMCRVLTKKHTESPDRSKARNHHIEISRLRADIFFLKILTGSAMWKKLNTKTSVNSFLITSSSEFRFISRPTWSAITTMIADYIVDAVEQVQRSQQR